MGGLYDHFKYNSLSTNKANLGTKDEWVATGLLSNSIFITNSFETIDK